jgi:CBS domain-containing protein
MKVSEVCARRTVACRRDTTLAEAAALLHQHGADALPVVDALGRVLGMISEHDLARGLDPGGRAAGRRVGDVMDQDLATCHPSDEVRHVLPLMGLLSTGRLPVVDDRDRLWGVLEIEDVLCRSLAGGDARDLPAAEVLDTFCRITRRDRLRLAAATAPRAA